MPGTSVCSNYVCSRALREQVSNSPVTRGRSVNAGVRSMLPVNV